MLKIASVSSKKDFHASEFKNENSLFSPCPTNFRMLEHFFLSPKIVFVQVHVRIKRFTFLKNVFLLVHLDMKMIVHLNHSHRKIIIGLKMSAIKANSNTSVHFSLVTAVCTKLLFPPLP
jgi:hypothetical protein